MKSGLGKIFSKFLHALTMSFLPIDHFGTEHFGTNVSSQEHFGTCTVRRCGRSGRWTFQHQNISTWGIFGTGNFRHEEFSAPEHFGTGIFWHLNISAHGYFGTLQSNMDFSAQTFWHLCYCAKMSMCRNVPVPKCSCAENSSCRKVPMSKCSRVEMSICRNVCSTEWCTCRNVPVMKHPCQNDSCRNDPCRNGL